MKSRILFALPLIATLTFSAVAQQAAPTEKPSAAQATAQSTADTSTPAATPDRQLEPLKPDTHEGFWGHLNPFARKKYVQRQVAPIRERANELDELTTANARMLKDVDARATAGIQRADAHATLADQHAVDGAQNAYQTANAANTQLTNVSQAVDNIDQYQRTSQVEIRFRRGSSRLSPDAKDALDQLATAMKGQKGALIEVQGFTPGRGQASIQKSQHLADSVVRYLVINHQIPVYRIYKLGMGNAQITSETEEHYRGSRVEVTLMKNGVGDLQAAPAPASMAQSQPE
jgi:outer membrane protein OmpA-like peptidoglycan-associated protein